MQEQNPDSYINICICINSTSIEVSDMFSSGVHKYRAQPTNNFINIQNNVIHKRSPTSGREVLLPNVVDGGARFEQNHIRRPNLSFFSDTFFSESFTGLHKYGLGILRKTLPPWETPHQAFVYFSDNRPS